LLFFFQIVTLCANSLKHLEQDYEC
jgi:hypothetical protein